MKEKLTRSNPYMFQVVQCRAYMKKINDGRCITVIPGKRTESGNAEYFYTDNNLESEKDRMREVPWEDWGGSDFTKTYFQRTEKQFTGIIIGLKEIVVKANLYCDTNYGYDGSEIDYVGKEVTEQIKVAVVAYGCNRTRCVPLDDLVILEVENGYKDEK